MRNKVQELLVGGLIPLKHMKVSWDDSSQYMEKIKFMFQTTNQIMINDLNWFFYPLRSFQR